MSNDGNLHNLCWCTTNAKCSLSRILSSFSRVVSRVTFLKVVKVALETASVGCTLPLRSLLLRLPNVATP